MRPLSSFLSLALCAALTGCGMGVIDQNPVNSFPMVDISGKVHGGQQPIVGAQVYLYAAGSSGYGTGATSLLNSPGYVITQADGSFTLNGAYSLSACQTAHQQVYLIAVGGNPGAGTNNDSVLMSALGDCANLTAGTFVWMNEVTTVASVYALQQFMTPGTYNVGTSSTNLLGLKNAFLTVPNLVDTSKGTPYTTTPGGNGTVPQNEIYYLANILAACVNSTTGSSQCSALFAAAEPPGGTAPTDTLGAILDIALNPGNNASTLYALPPPVVAFPTTLTQPNDWTIAVKYTGGGLNSPGNLAIDAADNIWITNVATGGALSEFNTVGVSEQGSTGVVFSGTLESYGIAIAPSGTIWVGEYFYRHLSSFSSTGSLSSTTTWTCFAGSLATDAVGDVFAGNYEGPSPSGGNQVCEEFVTNFSPGSTSPYSESYTLPFYNNAGALTVAIDASANVWIPNYSTSGVFKLPEADLPFNPRAATVYTDTQLDDPWFAAIDAEGGVWAANLAGSKVVNNVNSAGVAQGNGYAIPNYSYTVAIDGSDTVWLGTTSGSLAHLAHSGAAISPAVGYVAPGSGSMDGLGIDGAGNIWTADWVNNNLVEWIGVAAPVVTPISQNLANVPTTIGQRP